MVSGTRHKQQREAKSSNQVLIWMAIFAVTWTFCFTWYLLDDENLNLSLYTNSFVKSNRLRLSSSTKAGEDDHDHDHDHDHGHGHGHGHDDEAKLFTLQDLVTFKGLPNTDALYKQMAWREMTDWLYGMNIPYLDLPEPDMPDPKANFTLVSCMFDLGRGDLAESFRRPFSYYVEKFSVFLQYKQPKVVIIEPRHRHLFQPYIDRSPGPVYVLEKTVQEIKDNFPMFDTLQKIRTDPKWATREHWLSESPQAMMAYYNPTVMSKIFWVRDVARLNPFNTDLFMWIDGAHLCNNPARITPDRMDVFREKMDRLFITYFDYQAWTEIHGFEKAAFFDYLGIKDPSQLVRVGRGGIFGGSKRFLEVSSEIYDVMLHETLSKGYMGTEENLFSMLEYTYPHLVHDYDNGDGGNCAIFSDALNVFNPDRADWNKIVRTRGYDLRGVSCVEEQFVDPSSGVITKKQRKCLQGGIQCPAWVTPLVLSKADKQWACHSDDFYCTVGCTAGSDEILWFANSCPAKGPCPPYLLVRHVEGEDGYTPVRKDAEKRTNKNPHAVEAFRDFTSAQLRASTSLPVSASEAATYFAKVKTGLDNKLRKNLEKYGWDLRGLQCEVVRDPTTKELREQCFMADLPPSTERDLCPSYVNSAYLSSGAGQYACLPEVENTYCTAVCQDNNPVVSWRAHDHVWCASHPGECPTNVVVPFHTFKVNPWSQPPKAIPACDVSPRAEQLLSTPLTEPVTIGILARCGEEITLASTLESYARLGFLQTIDESLIFVNEVCDDIVEVIKPYTAAPYNLKLLHSDKNNHGILNGINWLIGNSTNELFLFLEKDFRLVESLACSLEQLQAGITMIRQGTAQVVKYRSRYNAGRPNWADIMYRDHEDDVFDRQPNLLCNFYHWLENPEKRYPDYFSVCHNDPKFYCSKAFYCNWTNNPQLFTKEWWTNEYLNKYPDLLVNGDPGFGLEGFMNWHIGAWNERNFVVAQGEGMFKHCDTRNLGV